MSSQNEATDRPLFLAEEMELMAGSCRALALSSIALVLLIARPAPAGNPFPDLFGDHPDPCTPPTVESLARNIDWLERHISRWFSSSSSFSTDDDSADGVGGPAASTPHNAAPGQTQTEEVHPSTIETSASGQD